MPQIIQGYAVYTVIDEMGRKGKLVGYFTLKHHAEIAAKGKGYFGPGEIEPVWIYDEDGSKMYVLKDRLPIAPNVDLVQMEAENKETAKRKLLAHLTADEIRTLGLDPNRL